MPASLCPGHSRDHWETGSPGLGWGLDILLCQGLDLQLLGRSGDT